MKNLRYEATDFNGNTVAEARFKKDVLAAIAKMGYTVKRHLSCYQNPQTKSIVHVFKYDTRFKH